MKINKNLKVIITNCCSKILNKKNNFNNKNKNYKKSFFRKI